MTVRISAAVASADVSSIKLRASVSVVAPVVGVTMQIPVSRIDYIDLGVGARLDSTGRFRFIQDAAVVVEGLSLQLSKPLSDAISVELDQFSWELERSINDEVGLTDVLTKTITFIREFADELDLNDFQQIQLAKAFNDFFGTLDFESRVIDKAISDGVAMNDLADLIDGITFEAVKSVMNMVFTGDSKSLFFGRPLFDSIGPTDSTSLEPQLAKTDSVGTTDASLRDTFKGLFDQQALNDVVQFALSKAISHAVTLLDATAISVDRPLSDSFGTQDAHSHLFNKPASDSFSFVDSETKSFTKSAQSAVDPLDALSFDWSKQLQNEFGLADAQQYSFSKPAQSAFSTSDDLSRAMSRLFTDGVGINDSAETVDGLLFQTTKTFSNVAFATDSSSLTVSRLLAHSTGVGDEGSLVNQGYCDLTYFAGDYVGDSRAF